MDTKLEPAHNLTIFRQLPIGLKTVFCCVGYNTNGMRVHVRLEGVYAGSEARELIGTCRIGLVLWRHIVGPALGHHIRSQGVDFELEPFVVQNKPASPTRQESRLWHHQNRRK